MRSQPVALNPQPEALRGQGLLGAQAASKRQNQQYAQNKIGFSHFILRFWDYFHHYFGHLFCSRILKFG
jgi:hypothetical protein